MKKLAKNIPTHYNFPGTPIFRDTTALPFAEGGPLHDRDINGRLLNSTYASPLGNMYREGGPFGEDQGTFDYASSVYASQPGNYFKDGGQFQGNYSLPEDSFKQGGNNLHNSVYASSPQQYPAVYNFGGTLKNNLATRQQMYMPLDHITRTGGSILSMSNTPEMSGEGKDLVYANGGALNNSYAGGGQIYTYAGRPGAEYQKGANGWEIRTEHTNGFVPVKDPTGKRTALLNAQAKPSTAKASSAGQTPFVHPDAGATAGLFQKAVPAVPNSQYDKNAQVDYQAKLKPVVADNTRDVTADQTLAAIQNAAYMESPEYKARQKAEKEAQAAFEKEQWDKYNKMSFGEKVLDRTNAALNQWPVMLSNTIAGEQAYIPGMASGLGDGGPDYDRWLKATGQTRGFSINDAVNVFNPGSWGGHAGRQYGEGNYATGAGELGLGLLGLKGAPLMGNQLAKSSAKGLINLEQKAGQAYNKVATGNSRLPYAWKMENINNAVPLLKNKYDLTDAEAFVLGKYINTPYAIKRGTEESEIFDNLIKRNSAILDEVNTPVTKVLNHSTNFGKDIVPSTYGSTFTFPGNRSWSLGVDPRFADTNRTRLVIPSKYNKDLGFTAVPYDDTRLVKGWNAYSKGTPLTELNMSAEKELLGNLPKGYKVIGRSNEGGFENIFIKPNTKFSKELPGSPNTSLKPEGNKVFGTYGHDIETNPNIVYKESESGNIIPFNNATGKPLQEEYVNNMKEYYDSPEFKRIMKEEHPNVDIEQYKKVTLENLEKELTYNPSEVADNYGGVYTTKNSSSAAYMPGNAPTFKQRVANANTNDYQYQNNQGISHISDPSTTWHELSHQRTNADELLPNELTRSHLEENALPFAENLEYHAMPTEFDVRLRQLKEDLKTQGINDYFNTPVTAEHISKLDASKLKDEGDFLFKEMKNQYRELKNSGASEDVLEKVKNQYFNNIGKLDEKMGTIKTSTDTQDLLKRWTPEFLAKKARTLPALFPAAGIAGGSALLANPWQQQPKGL